MNDRYLSAYYFMGQDLCMVRQHTRNDMLWLRDHGFDAINVGVHEEQYRQPLGLQLVIDEARKAGLAVIAIPSRWCGLIAGWPVLAGHFAASRPDVWMRNAGGGPVLKSFCGPLCSVNHPDVRAHMIACTERMLATWDLDGIMWDELKTLHETDHHPLAIEKFGGPVSGAPQVAASLEIFAACNRAARAVKPDLRICSFLYAYLPDDMVAAWAATEGFDDIGLDGKLGWAADYEVQPPHDKTLLQHAPRFIAAAKANGRRSFALIETQHFDAREAEMTLRRAPELLAMGLDHLAVYYHPLVQEPAAQITDRIGPVLRDWRRG
jgi:hypothetical protein